MNNFIKNDLIELKIALSDYPSKLKASKKRLILACIFSALMLVGTIVFVPDMSVKSICICIFCSLIAGVFAGFPALRVNRHFDNALTAIILLGYFFVVPPMLFIRTETVTHDISSLITGTRLLNLLIMLVLFCILLLITQKTSLALGIEGIILLLLTIANFYVYKFRGSGLSFFDFAATKTAVMVMGNYNYSITGEVWKSVCYYVLFICIGFRIKFNLKGLIYHLSQSVIAIVIIALCVCFFKFSNLANNPVIKGRDGNILAGQKIYGLYYYLYLSSSVGGMEKPSNYSDDSLTAASDFVEKEYSSDFYATVKQPNIILIMNEAWSDLRVLGTLETTDPFSPYIDSLKGTKNTAYGYTFVNIQGGLTANSEYEGLTGDSLTLLNPASVPYQMQIKHSMPSLATVLSQQGYSTIAMHPNTANSWNRDMVYDYFGFDEFISIDKFESNMKMYGSFLADSSNYDEIIYRYENRDTESPLFLFDVTIQNHSPYGEQIPLRLTTNKIGDRITNEYYEVNEYLSLMNETDSAFEELVEYFSKVSEPTIILMYGDHQPILPERFYNDIFEGRNLSDNDKKYLEYQTPYIIWANYDIDIPEYGDINASYIPSILCELSGNELPTYYKFLSLMRQNYPAFNIYSSETRVSEEMMNIYHLFMYNRLIDADFRNDIFLIK